MLRPGGCQESADPSLAFKVILKEALSFYSSTFSFLFYLWVTLSLLSCLCLVL